MLRRAFNSVLRRITRCATPMARNLRRRGALAAKHRSARNSWVRPRRRTTHACTHNGLISFGPPPFFCVLMNAEVEPRVKPIRRRLGIRLFRYRRTTSRRHYLPTHAGLHRSRGSDSFHWQTFYDFLFDFNTTDVGTRRDDLLLSSST